MEMGEVFAFLRAMNMPGLTRIEEADFSGIDLVFCALPHATSQSVIKGLPRDLKVVDLSADFRLRDPAAYEKWYGKPHAAVAPHRTIGWCKGCLFKCARSITQPPHEYNIIAINIGP